MGKVRGFKKRLEPFGATKARGKQFEAERKLKNRIHELEQQLEVAQRANANLVAGINEANRQRDAASPNTAQMAALKAIGDMSVLDAIEVGILEHAIELGKWFRSLQTAGGILKLAKPIHVPVRQSIADQAKDWKNG